MSVDEFELHFVVVVGGADGFVLGVISCAVGGFLSLAEGDGEGEVGVGEDYFGVELGGLGLEGGVDVDCLLFSVIFERV